MSATLYRPMWGLFSAVFFFLVVRAQEAVRGRHARGNSHGQGHGHKKWPKKDSIPLLAVTLNDDRRRYLVRLLKSIDHPVDLIQITIGNSNDTAVSQMISDAKLGEQLIRKKFRNTHVHIVTLRDNPGAAYGFNVALRYLQSTLGEGKGFEGVAKAAGVHGEETPIPSGGHGNSLSVVVEDEFAERAKYRHESNKYTVPEWGLVVNADISFYPGVLSKLSTGVEWNLATNDKFGIGFTSLCCGSEWSAVIFTSRVASQVGLMDENFYPAYYEDEDYGIRVRLSGLQAVRIDETPMHHGELDGSKDYLSGLFDELYLHPKQDEGSKRWRESHQRGVKYGHSYLEDKWGVQVGHFDTRGTFHEPPKNVPKLDCKSVEGINGKCRPGFIVPFNNQSMTIKHWYLDVGRRAGIVATSTS